MTTPQQQAHPQQQPQSEKNESNSMEQMDLTSPTSIVPSHDGHLNERQPPSAKSFCDSKDRTIAQPLQTSAAPSQPAALTDRGTPYAAPMRSLSVRDIPADSSLATIAAIASQTPPVLPPSSSITRAPKSTLRPAYMPQVVRAILPAPTHVAAGASATPRGNKVLAQAGNMVNIPKASPTQPQYQPNQNHGTGHTTHVPITPSGPEQVLYNLREEFSQFRTEVSHTLTALHEMLLAANEKLAARAQSDTHVDPMQCIVNVHAGGVVRVRADEHAMRATRTGEPTAGQNGFGAAPTQAQMLQRLQYQAAPRSDSSGASGCSRDATPAPGQMINLPLVTLTSAPHVQMPTPVHAQPFESGSSSSRADGALLHRIDGKQSLAVAADASAPRGTKRHRRENTPAPPAKRRRDNWTEEENTEFIRLVLESPALEEMDLRRMLARAFSPRRTHEQCANHLRILRAQGKLPASKEEIPGVAKA